MRRILRYTLGIIAVGLLLCGATSCTHKRTPKPKFQVIAIENIKGSLGKKWSITLTIANTTARDLHATAILTVTRSGYTAQHLSKFRPAEPIVAATPNQKTYNQLALCWGVYPIRARYQADTNVLVTHAIDCAKRFGYVNVGDRVVVTAGGTGESGTTDVLKVQLVPEPIK